MGNVLFRFLARLAEKLRDQPCNDELIEYVLDRGVHSARELEDLGAREVAGILCGFPGGYEYRSIVGSFSYVADHELVEDCVARGGEAVIAAHSHPGGAAVPSSGDVRGLLGLVEAGRAPEYYCWLRRGCRGVRATCLRVPRDPEALRRLEYLAMEELYPYLDVYEAVEIDLGGAEATSIIDDAAAEQAEELFMRLATEEKLAVFLFSELPE